MRFTSILMAVLLAMGGSAAAEVAETYQVEAGRGTGLASSVAVDITGHEADSLGVWLATGRGVSYSFDNGLSWYSNNTASGLPADNLSAIHSLGDRIWVASNHNEMVAGQLMTLSNGLSYSDDNGLTWTTLDFSSTGLNIPYVIGGDRTIYDLTGHHDVGFLNNRLNDTTDWMFAAAFAGSLLASQDGGLHWRRIYASRNDSIQFSYTTEAPSLRNRYFACVADTSHGDSLFLWGGTAAGVFQYVFAPPREKLYSRWINNISLCDTCTKGDGARLFIGGESGLSLGSTDAGAIGTRFEVDGLPVGGTNVVSVFNMSAVVFAGTVNPSTGASTGMVISTDGGESFTEVSPQPAPLDDQSIISDFTTMGGRVYAAAQSAGLLVSDDLGSSWSAVPLSTYYSSPSLLTVHSVYAYYDSLFVGTDSGLIQLTLDGSGGIVANSHVPFVDSDSSGARIARIKVQEWESDLVPFNRILWTINKAASPAGTPVISRYGPVVDTSIADIDTITIDPFVIDTIWLIDTLSFAWNHYRVGVDVYDVNFFSDTVFAVGENGIWFAPRIAEPNNFFSARQLVYDSIVVDNLDNDTVTVMQVKADTVIFGCSNGVAISHNRGESFQIYRANRDSLSADFVVNHSYLTSLGGLAGDFVPALAVQYRPSGSARVWAGCRPAEYGYIGISYGEYDDDGTMVWNVVNEDDYAWNFEFMGDTIFAATNGGLLMNDGVLDSLDTEWATVSFIDESSGERLIEAGTSTYGVALVDSLLWVGTDDGTVSISRTDLGDMQLFKRVDSTTSADDVYAFPVPFRPGLGQTVDFHFVLEEAGTVTLSIYDFAMNLVATPIDNVHHNAGIYPTMSSQGTTWDGYNDKGDLVAVGVYYFKLEDGSGDARWGKLAVIP